jgi:N-acetylneuraminic acid mutarotase
MKWLNGTQISNFGWILISLVLSGLLSIAPMSQAAEGTWTRKSDMPTARVGVSTCVVDGKIYAVGGAESSDVFLSTVEEYDPATDTWTRKTDMPTVRSSAATSVVNGKIYVMGGAPGRAITTPTVEEYDPATDTWTKKADMPTSRSFFSASVVKGKIYAVGGWTEIPERLVLSTVEEYDPATNTWTRKADMPAPRGLLSTSVVDGRIYAIGGVLCSEDATCPHVFPVPAVSTVEEYDPVTDTWTRKADMPTARKGPGTCVVDGKIYAIGGSTGADAPPVDPTGFILSTVEEYNPATDTWTTKIDMPTPRTLLSTSVVNGKIYAIGGDVAFWPWSPTPAVEEYTVPEWPLAGAWVEHIPPWETVEDPGIVLHNLTPLNPAGNRLLYTVKFVNEVVSLPGLPPLDYVSQFIGEAMKTGRNTYEYTVVGYAAIQQEEPGQRRGQVRVIAMITGRSELLDRDYRYDTQIYMWFTADQDVDPADGFPDEGQEAIMTLGPFGQDAFRRVPLVPLPEGL